MLDLRTVDFFLASTELGTFYKKFL